MGLIIQLVGASRASVPVSIRVAQPRSVGGVNVSNGQVHLDLITIQLAQINVVRRITRLDGPVRGIADVEDYRAAICTRGGVISIRAGEQFADRTGNACERRP